MGFLHAHVINIADTAKLPFNAKLDNSTDSDSNSDGEGSVDGDFEVISVMSGSDDSEYFPTDSRHSFKIGSVYLEQPSRDCVDDNVIDSLTQQKIDEVVGSFNLSELKKFRLELIKYVSNYQVLELIIT